MSSILLSLDCYRNFFYLLTQTCLTATYIWQPTFNQIKILSFDFLQTCLTIKMSVVLGWNSYYPTLIENFKKALIASSLRFQSQMQHFNWSHSVVGIVLVDLTRDTIECQADENVSHRPHPRHPRTALVHCQNSPRIYGNKLAGYARSSCTLQTNSRKLTLFSMLYVCVSNFFVNNNWSKVG